MIIWLHFFCITIHIVFSGEIEGHGPELRISVTRCSSNVERQSSLSPTAILMTLIDILMTRIDILMTLIIDMLMVGKSCAADIHSLKSLMYHSQNQRLRGTVWLCSSFWEMFCLIRPPTIYFSSNFTLESTSQIDKPLITEQLVEFISDPLSSKVSILGLWDYHQSISRPILV